MPGPLQIIKQVVPFLGAMFNVHRLIAHLIMARVCDHLEPERWLPPDTLDIVRSVAHVARANEDWKKFERKFGEVHLGGTAEPPTVESVCMVRSATNEAPIEESLSAVSSLFMSSSQCR